MKRLLALLFFLMITLSLIPAAAAEDTGIIEVDEVTCDYEDIGDENRFRSIVIKNAGGLIKEDPKSVTAEVGTTVQFSIKLNGEPSNPIFHWQYRRGSQYSWRDYSSPDSNTKTLTIRVTDELDGYQFRCNLGFVSGYSEDSMPATLTVLKAPVIMMQPEPVTQNEGKPVSFTVIAKGGALNYQWQYKKTTTDSWYNCSSIGSQTETLSVSATAARNGFQFRCKVTNSLGTVYSNTATLTVALKPRITSHPTSKTVKEDITAEFAIVTKDAESYQWQYRKTSSDSWYNSTLTGAKTATLFVPATAARNGFQFRCKVSNQIGTAYSNVATLTVLTKPCISAQPSNQIVIEGNPTTFYVSATGVDTYQWQYRKSSSNEWYNSGLTGNKTASLTVQATEARNNFQFRCKLSNENGSVYTNSVKLTVKLPPVITSQPQSISTTPDVVVAFHVSASRASSYRWQYRTSADGDWKNSTATGYNTSTLSITASSNRDGYQYRCKVSNADGTAITDIALLSVCVNPIISTHPKDVTAMEGATVTFSVNASGGGLTYQWQYRKGNTGSWYNCSAKGAKSASLQIEATEARNGFQFRCKVTNTVGVTFSNAATLTVQCVTS